MVSVNGRGDSRLRADDLAVDRDAAAADVDFVSAAAERDEIFHECPSN